MKSTRRILSCGLGLAASFYLCFVHAQSTDSSGSEGDLATMIQAIELATPTPATSLPTAGTFWSAQHAPGTAQPWPPLPGNVLGLDAWSLGDNVFLVNDTNVDYPALAAAAEAAQASSASPMMRMSMMASSLATTYAYGNPVYLTNMAASFAGDGSMTASFSIGGGTNFVPYDIWMSTNVATPIAGWNWLGIGYTANDYTFTEQPAGLAFYILAKPSKTMTVGIGNDTVGQCDVPLGLTNAVQVAGGGGQSLALLNNGTVVAWGENYYGEGVVPTNLNGVAMVSAGWYHNVALLTNGTVTAWGISDSPLFGGLPVTNVPPNLTNITVISAQALHTLALESNGTVVAWGYGEDGETSVPAGLTNVTAISAGYKFNLAVSNGMVVAWGDNSYGQCDVPAGLTNVVDVEAGVFHSLALLNNGTVAAWGDDMEGETDVPPGLTNVVAIAASGDPDIETAYSMALKSDGSVVVWGEDEASDPCDGLSNVVAIAAGADNALVVRTGPPTPVITEEPTDEYQIQGGNATFTARGAGLYGVTYQWQTNGVNLAGATNATLILTNAQTAQLGSYNVVVTDNGGMGSLVSSNASLYLVTPPVITSETLPTNQVFFVNSIVTLGASASAPGQINGFPISYQWQFDGTNITGQTSSNDTFSATNSGTYSLIVSNAAGSVTVAWVVNVVRPGNAWGWGDNTYGESAAPLNITNISAIAAGEYHAVAVEDNGSVIQWGYNWGDIPHDLTNAVAVSAGYEHAIALRRDGTVETWGQGEADYVPTNLAGVKAVAAGWGDNVVLLTNGTVTAWGTDAEILDLGNLTDTAGLTNVTAISAAAYHALALTTNGTVLAWGDDEDGESDVPVGLSNVVAVAAGGEHSLALLGDGTVVAWGYNNAGQCSVPVGLTNVMAIAAGWEHSVALLNNGTVIVWGDNSFAQTNIPSLNQVKLIAAGGNFTIAGVFSPTVMYPVDVTKDLLLIYNTNSADSTLVLNYYLQHRPMVSEANILGIGFPGFYVSNLPAGTGLFSPAEGFVGMTNTTDYETICPADFTNEILNPVENWLAQNPTKRPQYVVLFLDVPSRVNGSATTAANAPFYDDPGTEPSASYQLATGIANWQPFVTHINMNGTNDCIGYINKLAVLGTNCSTGNPVFSANANGYANANYYIDDGNNQGYPEFGATALPGILAANSNASVIYSNNVDTGIASHITTGTNVAGYFCWGGHCTLGAHYANNGSVQWSDSSSCWLIETAESFNGQRYEANYGNYIDWFSSDAFGGINYFNTPVGAVSYTDEPELPGVNDPSVYFGLWEAEKNFGICSWASRRTQRFQAVGDPFITK